MILKNLNVYEIRSDAIKAFSGESSKTIFVLYYYFLPFFTSLILYIYDYYVQKEVSGNLISGISLLSGLMFSLLVVITKNFSNRKNQLKDNKEEEIINYIARYKEFANNLIAVISFAVVKSILIIAFLVFVNSYYEYLNQQVNFVYKITWLVIYILLIQYVMFILFIIKNMYTMLYDDINSTL